MSRKVQISAAAVAQKADAIAKTLAMGQTYHNQGQLKLAEGFYKQVLSLDPNHVDATHLLGVVALQSGGRLDESIRLLKKAHRRNPKAAAILVNLGSALRQAEKLHEAKDAYEEAIRLAPGLAGAHYNLGRVLFDLEKVEDAVRCYLRALELTPNDPDVHVNLGNAYKFIPEPDKALAAYERALELSPGLAEAHGNIAAIYTDMGQYEKALACLDAAIAIKPQPGELRFKRSLVLLRSGRLAEGWRDYESRFLAEREPTLRFPEPPPYWQGEDLKDKTILLWTEQGLGDEILYGSMIPEVAARARACILECSPRMVSVFARTFPEIQVVRYQGQGTRTTLPSAFDVQRSVVSLGQYFRPDFASFPKHQGYMRAHRPRTAQLRAKYETHAAGKMIVGVSWRSKKLAPPGENRKTNFIKSMDLTAWQPVLQAPGIAFINLQYGECEEDLTAVREKLGVEVFQDRDVDSLRSMDDFFSQVAAMDAVVTTSNTTVHVAGSLNIPTFLMVPPAPMSLWYWFLEGHSTPWYPSVKIFRAPPRDRTNESVIWDECLEQIRNLLDTDVGKHRLTNSRNGRGSDKA